MRDLKTYEIEMVSGGDLVQDFRNFFSRLFSSGSRTTVSYGPGNEVIGTYSPGGGFYGGFMVGFGPAASVTIGEQGGQAVGGGAVGAGLGFGAFVGHASSADDLKVNMDKGGVNVAPGVGSDSKGNWELGAGAGGFVLGGNYDTR